MRVAKLGQGLTSCPQGLGCASLTNSFYKTGITEEQGIALVKHALSLGVTHFDTALAYGPYESEIILGKAIKGFPREKLLIATKTGLDMTKSPPEINNKPHFLRQTCMESLKRLQLEYIDLFYLHRIDVNTPIEESMGELKKLTQEGKIRFIGLSEASADTIRRAHAVHPVSAVQVEWSLWTRDAEKDIVPTCKELGIGVVAYSPLGRGFLAGAFKSRDDFQDGDLRKARHPRFQEDSFDRNLAASSKFIQVAEKKGCTPAQLSLAWIMAQGDFVCPIPGTSKINRLEENVKANDIILTKTELDNLNGLFEPGEILGDRAVSGLPTFRDN